MDKIITAMFNLLIDNKSSSPLFIVLAGFVGIWAISGGANNLFGASSLKALEENHIKFKTSFEVCLKQNTVDRQTIETLNLKVAQLENLNALFKILLQSKGVDTQPLLDATNAGILPEVPVLPQTK